MSLTYFLLGHALTGREEDVEDLSVTGKQEAQLPLRESGVSLLTPFMLS